MGAPMRDIPKDELCPCHEASFLGHAWDQCPVCHGTGRKPAAKAPAKDDPYQRRAYPVWPFSRYYPLRLVSGGPLRYGERARGAGPGRNLR